MPAITAGFQCLIIVIPVFVDLFVNGYVFSDIKPFLQQKQGSQKTGYAPVSVPERVNTQKINDHTGNQ